MTLTLWILSTACVGVAVFASALGVLLWRCLNDSEQERMALVKSGHCGRELR